MLDADFLDGGVERVGGRLEIRETFSLAPEALPDVPQFPLGCRGDERPELLKALVRRMVDTLLAQHTARVVNDRELLTGISLLLGERASSFPKR